MPQGQVLTQWTTLETSRGCDNSGKGLLPALLPQRSARSSKDDSHEKGQRLLAYLHPRDLSMTVMMRMLVMLKECIIERPRFPSFS